MSTSESNDFYDNMLAEHPRPYCWICGRDENQRPGWWHAPWLIERAHLVNQPRVLDRRAIVLLCSLCHRISHGDNFPEINYEITKANLVWAKAVYDESWFDPGFLRQHSVAAIPEPQEPDVKLINQFGARRQRWRWTE